MTPLEVLIAARALIADEENWTAGTWARDKHGYGCNPATKQAVCWCAVGAITHVLGKCPGRTERDARYEYTKLGEAVIDTLSAQGRHISSINDDEGHAAVLARYDAAIAAERAKVSP